MATVARTTRAARIDDYTALKGEIAAAHGAQASSRRSARRSRSKAVCGA